VYDAKTVRRRRAVLGLLVLCSLVLLTASFGGSGGPVGSVQRGVSEVLNPVQDGASRALKPVRDLFGWFGDTLNAKGRLAAARTERDGLRREVVRLQDQARQNDELRRQLSLNRSLGLSGYRPQGARVISQSPTIWYAQVTINRGSSEDVRAGMPVIDDEGLVGTVTQTTRSSAVVTLITDHTSGVSARTNAGGVPGIVKPSSAGNPSDLILDNTGEGRIQQGDRVVTRGTTAPRLPSPFPPGLPIGQVTRVQDPGTDTQEVHLRPFANLSRLELVQVLTAVPGNDDS
jgi:rod shape-determining protein MreC